MQELKELFLKLQAVGSPSGFEEPMIRLLKEELEPLCDEVYDTLRGNVIGVQKGTDPDAPSVALVAHMDQVGFIVSNIDDRGFIRFRKLGGAVNRCIQGQQLALLTERGPIQGVVGIKPGHITPPEEANQVPPINEMYIDIGAQSREEATDLGVEIGTPIVISAKPVELANDLIASPAVDDRAGLTAIITIAKHLKEQQVPSTVYYVGSVEEEIGLRGASVALYDLDVDFAVAIDTCPAGYQPDVVMRDLYYEVGRGPGIHIGEVGRSVRLGSQVVRRWLVETAKREGVPYQTALMHGGTDTSALQQTRGGIPSCTIGIPRRYSHSPVEAFDLKDLANLIEILEAGITSLEPGFNLHRV